MGGIKEAIELIKAQKLDEANAREVERQGRLEAEAYKSRAREAASERAFSECQQILESGHVSEVLAEINTELFKGNGKPMEFMTTGSIWDSYGFTTGNFSKGIGLEVIARRTPVLLTARAKIYRAQPYDNPVAKLHFSCRAQIVRRGGLREFFQKSTFWDSGADLALTSKVDGQEGPVNEWEDVNNVRRAFANVMVRKNIV